MKVDDEWRRLRNGHLHPFGLAAIARAVSTQIGEDLPQGELPRDATFDAYRMVDEPGLAALAQVRGQSATNESAHSFAINEAIPATIKRDAARLLLTDESISVSTRQAFFAKMKNHLPRADANTLRQILENEEQRIRETTPRRDPDAVIAAPPSEAFDAR